MHMKNDGFKHKSRMQDYIFQRPTLTTTRDGSDGRLAHGKWSKTLLDCLDIITIFDIVYNLYRSLIRSICSPGFGGRPKFSTWCYCNIWYYIVFNSFPLMPLVILPISTTTPSPNYTRPFIFFISQY